MFWHGRYVQLHTTQGVTKKGFFFPKFYFFEQQGSSELPHQLMLVSLLNDPSTNIIFPKYLREISRLHKYLIFQILLLHCPHFLKSTGYFQLLFLLSFLRACFCSSCLWIHANLNYVQLFSGRCAQKDLSKSPKASLTIEISSVLVHN